MINAREWLDMLWLATWSGSLSIIVVLLSRAPVRRHFGAGIAYALWWLPWVTWLALLLPARTATLPSTLSLSPAVAPVQAMAVQPLPAAQGLDLAWPGLLLWWGGMIVIAALLARQQYRFERGMGVLARVPGTVQAWRAERTEGLPAVIGLLRPRIVLPVDVDTRYDDQERALILEHERAHLQRGDAWTNAWVALVRCVFWFNPLVHYAASRLRHDQELACDAVVVAAHPHARRRYGEAMLKTAVARPWAPLGCHWGFTHPMKERVMQLKEAIPSRKARRIGAGLVGVVAIAVAAAAWASLPPRQIEESRRVDVRSDGRDYQAQLRLRVDGGAARDITLVGRFGKPFSIRIDDSREGDLEMEGTVTQLDGRDGKPAYRLATRLVRDGEAIGSPVVVVAPDRDARIKLGKDASGQFDGIDLSLRIGAVNEEVLSALETAEHGTAQMDIEIAEAEREAQQAANEAGMVSADALLASNDVATSAAHARLAVNDAQAAAIAAADEAVEAAERNRQAQIERRVVRRSSGVAFPTPPVPPSPPSVQAPEAPPVPPAPAVFPGDTHMHMERRIRRGVEVPAATQAAVRIDSEAAAIAAGGVALTAAEADKHGLKAGYRWVDVGPVVSGKPDLSWQMQAAIMQTDKDGETPRFIGFTR